MRQFHENKILWRVAFFPPTWLAVPQPSSTEAAQAIRPFAGDFWKMQAMAQFLFFPYRKISGQMEKKVTSLLMLIGRGNYIPPTLKTDFHRNFYSG